VFDKPKLSRQSAQRSDLENDSMRVWKGYAAKEGKPKSRKSRTVPMEEKVSTTPKRLERRMTVLQSSGR
jgi:hypothetical protein